MKHFSLVKFTTLFLSFFVTLNLFTIQQTRAQNGLYKKSQILKAYADNYHPKINEPVKITIHFTSPGDFEKGTFNLGFRNGKGSGLEIISGDNLYQNSLSKGQNVDMTMYVKFIEKKLYDLNIRFFKHNKVLLTFYVGGAFRESEQVEKLNRDLERLKNAIENYKNKQIEIPLDLLYKARHYKYSQSQTIFTSNKYERSIIKELKKKNTELFNTLKQEIDSLTQEAIKLYKSFKKQKSLPYLPPEGEPQEPIWQKQERETTSTVLNVSKIKAIKNHKAPYAYYLQDLASGQIIPLSNIRVEPSTLGSILELADHSFEFIANNNIGSGTLYATNTLNNEQVSLPIRVFGDFIIEGVGQAEYCFLELYDIVDGNETKIDSTYANSDGWFSFAGVNTETFKIVAYAKTNDIVVYKTQPSNSAEIWSENIYSEKYYCSDHIDENNNKARFNFSLFGDWSYIENMIISLEKGFNFFSDLPKPLNVLYKKDANFTTSYNHIDDYMLVDGSPDEKDALDGDVLLHEFGHFYMDKKANIPPYIPAQYHSFQTKSSEKDAYVEGWGDFFSSFIRGSADYLDRFYDINGNPTSNLEFNLETPSYKIGTQVIPFTSVVPDGNEIEGDVAAVLWDLYDGANESWDQLSGLSDQVFEIMQSNTINGHTPYTIKEFSEVWASRKYPNIRELSSHHGIQVAEFTERIYGITPVFPDQANYSAEAAVQMMLNYMGVSATQSTIYSSAGGTNNLPLNSNQVLNAVTNLTNSNYTWSLVKDNDFQTVVDYMVKWIGYDFATNPNGPQSPQHLPCLAPFNSSYNDWRVINGFVVSSDPWQGGAGYTGNYTIYGFWVTTPHFEGGYVPPYEAPLIKNNISNIALTQSFKKGQYTSALNPNLPSGGTLGGGETFYSITSFQNSFSQINGYYETVLEPPENISKPFLGESYVMNIDNSDDPIQTVSNVLTDKFSKHKKIKNIIKQFDSYKNKIAMDLSFNKEYKIITLGKGNKTYLGIILDKSKQRILEMNIPEKPVKYKLISEKDAIKTLVKNNILKNNEAKSVDSRLVYLKDYSINRFYPLWELKKDSAIYYVNQDSKIINVNLSKKNESALVDKSMPKVFELRQNYPNPFNPSTTINYQLPNAGVVTLIIYDVLGKEVKTLVNDFKSKGRYSVNFNAGNLASGVYIYRLKVNDFSSVKKLLLLK